MISYPRTRTFANDIYHVKIRIRHTSLNFIEFFFANIVQRKKELCMMSKRSSVKRPSRRTHLTQPQNLKFPLKICT